MKPLKRIQKKEKFLWANIYCDMAIFHKTKSKAESGPMPHRTALLKLKIVERIKIK